MAPLPEVNYSSKGKKKMDDAKPSKNVDKFKKGKKNKHKKNKSKDQSLEKGKKSFKSVIVVVVLIILQRSAKSPNTWLTCTRNPSRRQEKLKDRMKLTSMLHPMKLQLRACALMKLPSQIHRSMTTLTGRTSSLNTTRIICLKTKNRLHLSY
jgi:hypothetical protein